MCGRYTYYSSDQILKQFKLKPTKELQLALKLPDNYNVSPGNFMPVIIRGEQEHELQLMHWGLIPVWSKTENPKLKLINARREGLLEKPIWKRLINKQRCIVPARGFYEWTKTETGKQPHYITPKKGEIFNFAGLWDHWHSPDGDKILSYSIITTNPNQEMKPIHDRMPVMLNQKQMDTWLSPVELDQQLLDDLLSPSPDGSLEITKVSRDVNNARLNQESLIYPLQED